MAEQGTESLSGGPLGNEFHFADPALFEVARAHRFGVYVVPLYDGGVIGPYYGGALADVGSGSKAVLFLTNQGEARGEGLVLNLVPGADLRRWGVSEIYIWRAPGRDRQFDPEPLMIIRYEDK